MTKSKKNKRVTVHFEGKEYHLRESDLRILELASLNNIPFTVDIIRGWLTAVQSPLSDSKVRVTLKKFILMGLTVKSTNKMKKDLAPKWGKQQHPDVKAVQRGDGTSRVVVGKTGRLNYYELTRRGKKLGDFTSNRGQQMLIKW